MNNVEVVIIIDNELVFYLFMVICVRRGVSTAKLKTMKKIYFINTPPKWVVIARSKTTKQSHKIRDCHTFRVRDDKWRGQNI